MTLLILQKLCDQWNPWLRKRRYFRYYRMSGTLQMSIFSSETVPVKICSREWSNIAKSTLYALKVEVSILLIGIALFVSSHYPGSFPTYL